MREQEQEQDDDEDEDEDDEDESSDSLLLSLLLSPGSYPMSCFRWKIKSSCYLCLSWLCILHVPLNLEPTVNFHWDLIRITHRTADKYTRHMQSQLLLLSFATCLSSSLYSREEEALNTREEETRRAGEARCRETLCDKCIFEYEKNTHDGMCIGSGVISILHTLVLSS